jgi:hypothetical protein
MPENENTEIKPCTLVGDIVSLGLSATWTSFFLKFYLEMNDDIKYSYSSILLLISLIGGFLGLFKGTYKLFFDIFNMGTIMNAKKYKFTANYLNSKIVWCIFSIIESASCISSMLLVQFFIPYTQENCHSYSHGLCIYGRIIAFFGIIYIIISILFIMAFLLVYCVYGRQHNNLFVQNIQNTVIENVPIIKLACDIVKLNDYECSICLEDGNESKDDKFIKTACGHHFHKQCLEVWVTNRQTCPSCRAVIDVNAMNDATTTTTTIVESGTITENIV